MRCRILANGWLTQLQLSNGCKIPRLIFGTWQLDGAEARQAVTWALMVGQSLDRVPSPQCVVIDSDVEILLGKLSRVLHLIF